MRHWFDQQSLTVLRLHGLNRGNLVLRLLRNLEKLNLLDELGRRPSALFEGHRTSKVETTTGRGVREVRRHAWDEVGRRLAPQPRDAGEGFAGVKMLGADEHTLRGTDLNEPVAIYDA